MQIIHASRDAILKPLQTVAGIIEKRHTQPILANVLIRQQGERVTFTGTDMEIQVQTQATIGTGSGEIATTVSAKKLIDILRALPDTDVSLELNASKLSLKTARSRFALQTLPPEDYPVMKAGEGAGQTGAENPEDLRADVTLPQKKLRHLLQMVHFAMAQQDIRFYLNGLLLVLGPSGLRTVATEGHRLAFCEDSEVHAAGQADAILPRKSVLELLRLLGDHDESVHVEIIGTQIRLRFGDIEFISKLLEGKFPDYQRVIPKGYQKVFSLDRESLAHALQRASILSNEKFRGVRLGLEPGRLIIQSSNTEQEEASEELDIDYGGAPLDIGFNVSYLLDVLATLKSEQVTMAFGDATSSALLTLPENDSFRYVLMPMRI
ncbi:MAG: DNA polymerase III subunit beta [Lautropia sp.]|nr:DNA polymerase III subunit beta [Lautropia sp.]